MKHGSKKSKEEFDYNKDDAKKAKKADVEIEVEDEEEDDEDEDEEEKSLTPGDLEKSLKKLESMAMSTDEARKQELLSKAQKGSINKSERDELFDLMGDKKKNSLSDEVNKGFGENDTLQKSLEVSNFLREQQDEIQKSLGLLSDHIEKSDSRQNEFNLILASAVTGIGRLVKSMQESLESYGSQPAHAPRAARSMPQAQALNKSFAGGPSAGDVLNKSQIKQGLESLLIKSLEKSGTTLLDTPNGPIDLNVEAAKFESTSMIDPAVVQMIKQSA
jgi:hypothetical protein